MKLSSMRSSTWAMAFAALIALNARAFCQSGGRMADRSKQVTASELVSLHVFVEEHGLITSIGLASNRGIFIHNKRGLLDAVVWDNDYIDLYAYFDKESAIEVTRENDLGEVESVFRFDFANASKSKWTAATDEIVERSFNLGGEFYDRLITAEFEQSPGAEAMSGPVVIAPGNCVCQFGSDTSCEGFNGSKSQCESGHTCGSTSQYECVWRGNEEEE